MTTQTTDASDHDEFEPAPPDKLYAHHRRQLSAMMDGELSPDEAKFMLRRLEHDATLAGCWERWQVCGDVLRGRHHTLLPADFAHRVALAIADDGRAAVAVSAGTKPRPRLARWGGGAALAASVAVVAFLVARQLPGDARSTHESSSAIVAQQVPATQSAAPAPAAPVETTPRTTTDTPTIETGAALATAAVAIAEVPRRASAGRARTQGQRAADRVQEARDVATPPPIVAAAELPELAEVPATDTAPAATGTDPFAAPSIAPARPWPRAILQAYPADSAFTAGYGSSSPGTSTGFAPFEPRPEPRLEPDTVPTPAQAEAADGAGSEPEARDGTPPR
jgi:negative regulator of sigma E activity